MSTVVQKLSFSCKPLIFLFHFYLFYLLRGVGLKTTFPRLIEARSAERLCWGPPHPWGAAVGWSRRPRGSAVRAHARRGGGLHRPE